MIRRQPEPQPIRLRFKAADKDAPPAQMLEQIPRPPCLDQPEQVGPPDHRQPMAFKQPIQLARRIRKADTGSRDPGRILHSPGPDLQRRPGNRPGAEMVFKPPHQIPTPKREAQPQPRQPEELAERAQHAQPRLRPAHPRR